MWGDFFGKAWSGQFATQVPAFPYAIKHRSAAKAVDREYIYIYTSQKLLNEKYILKMFAPDGRWEPLDSLKILSRGVGAFPTPGQAITKISNKN